MARKSWLDEKGETTLIDDYAHQTTSFIDAMADGKIDDAEIEAHEAKLVELMKKIEPKLDDEQHAEITELLCEMSAFNVMQMLHLIHQSRPKTKFVG
ncbi:MAG: hypothetical protein AB8B55_01620 [Mariniblastus sp.]